MRGIVLFAFFVFFPGVLLAQSSRVDVEGTVTDSLGAGLPGATVVLLEAADSSLVSYGVTNTQGAFRIRRVREGSYKMQVSFVGFQPYDQDLAVNGEGINVGQIVLNPAVSQLDALVVTDDHIPLVVKQDTIEYNAGAFQVRPNASVEDLLKRLPGVDVGRDGTIRAQGETVEQVLVDGKEFFGNDTRIATQNLPADAVDKVQVYDKQSDMAEFSGIDDGEETRTINLALKEDSKQGYFGNATGGYGNDEHEGRYTGKASVNRFSSTSQLSFLGNLNNVNEQGFSVSDYLSFSGGGQGGRMMGEVPLNEGVSDGFSVTSAGGINYNSDFSAKTSLQSSYFFSRIDNDRARTLSQQQLINASQTSSSFQATNQNSLSQNHRLTLNLDHTLDKSQDLRLRANLQSTESGLDALSSRDISDVENRPINNNNTLYASNAKEYGGGASVTYRKRLAEKGRTLVAEGRVGLNDGSMKGDLETMNAFFDPLGDVMTYEEFAQYQAQFNSTITNRQRLSWTEPLGSRKYVQLHGERREVREEQGKTILDVDEGIEMLNETLGNSLDQAYTYYESGIKARFNRDGGIFSVGVDVQSAQLKGTTQNLDESLKRRFVNLLPSAMFTHAFSAGKNVDLRYQTATREPSMYELQPFVDNSDPLTVYTGNPKLKPEYRHIGTAHLMMFDQFSFTSLFGFFQAQYTTDKISLARTIDEQLRQSVTTRNVAHDWMTRASVHFGTPLRSIGAKVNLVSETMYNRGIEWINDLENKTTILRQSIDLSFENRHKDLFDILIGARYTFNHNRYSLNPGLGRDYINRTFYTEWTYFAGNAWQFTTGFDYRLYADEVSGSAQKIPLWRVELSRMVMGERAEIQLVGLDLLNRNVAVNYSNTSSYIQEERIASLGRYVMLKFIYNLQGISRDGSGVQVFGGD